MSGLESCPPLPPFIPGGPFGRDDRSPGKTSSLSSSISCPGPLTAPSLPRWNLSCLTDNPGRPRDQKRVVWSLDAEQRMCPSGWNARDHTFESCANSSVSLGIGSGMDQWMMEPSEPPETRRSEWIGCQARAAGSEGQ